MFIIRDSAHLLYRYIRIKTFLYFSLLFRRLQLVPRLPCVLLSLFVLLCVLLLFV